MDYSYEIKANIDSDGIDAALIALGLTDVGANARSVYFFETREGDPALSLFDQDVVLRLRLDSGGADSTVKLRPFDTARAPARWRTVAEDDDRGYRIELDWASTDPVLSASLSTDIDPLLANAVIHGAEPTGAFSTDQRELLDAFTGKKWDLSTLRLLGPVRVRRWDDVDLADRRITCEEWVVGGTRRFLELSDREKNPSQGPATREHLLALYAELGLAISAAPQLKTKVVLDYFRDRDDLIRLNAEITLRESRGNDEDRRWFAQLLADEFVMRRASLANVDKGKYLESFGPSGKRETRNLDVAQLSDLTAVVTCTVDMREEDDTLNAFSNVRLFIRDAANQPWRLFAWANEPANR